jgi:hypothetical protein
VVAAAVVGRPPEVRWHDHPLTLGLISAGVAVLIALLGVLQSLRAQKKEQQKEIRLKEIAIVERVVTTIDLGVTTNVGRLRRFLSTKRGTPAVLDEAPFHLIGQEDVRAYVEKHRGPDFTAQLRAGYGEAYKRYELARVGLEGAEEAEEAAAYREAAQEAARELLHAFKNTNPTSRSDDA